MITANNKKIESLADGTVSSDAINLGQLSPIYSSGVFNTRQIIAGTGLTGGGTLSADRTINVAAADTTIIVNADNIQVGTINTANISNDQVTDTKLRNSVGNSVIGRSVTSTGDPGDITATASGQFLRRDGSSVLGFGAITKEDLPAGIGLGDVVSTRNLIAGSGLAGGGTLATDRTFNIGAADATIVVNADDIQVGIIGTGNISNNAVSDTKIRDSVATSVIGRFANSTGDPADIVASASGQFLRRAGDSTLGFGSILLSDLPITGDVRSSRNIIAGAGLVGGGTLDLDRSFDIVSADGTITVNPNNIQVGIIGGGNISNTAISLVKHADFPDGTVLGRPVGAGSGSPSYLTATDLIPIVESRDLWLTFGIADGTTSESVLPSSQGAGNWLFWLLPQTIFSDIPFHAYIGTAVDANVIPDRVCEWEVGGTFGHCQIDAYIYHADLASTGGASVTLIVTKNGLKDASLSGTVFSSTGRSNGTIVTCSYVDGDRFGVVVVPNSNVGNAGTAKVKFTVHVRLTK